MVSSSQIREWSDAGARCTADADRRFLPRTIASHDVSCRPVRCPRPTLVPMLMKTKSRSAWAEPQCCSPRAAQIRIVFHDDQAADKLVQHAA